MSLPARRSRCGRKRKAAGSAVERPVPRTPLQRHTWAPRILPHQLLLRPILRRQLLPCPVWLRQWLQRRIFPPVPILLQRPWRRISLHPGSQGLILLCRVFKRPDFLRATLLHRGSLSATSLP